VDLGIALVAGSEAPEVVQVRKAALDDPALATEARAVCCATAGDDGRDAECSEQPTVLVVVIATVGQQPVGLLARPSDLAGDWPPVEIFDQRDQLGNVVTVSTGEADCQWNAAGVNEQMVL
jgi:hypothetical protein